MEFTHDETPTNGLKELAMGVGQQKYRLGGDGVEANTSCRALGAGSRMIADRVARFYSSVLPRRAAGRLVDLGCGESPLRPFYERYVSESWSIDWPSSLHGGSAFDVLADLNNGVPLRSGSVDTIIASDVLEHLRSPGSFLDECHRVLRPRATLVLNVPFMYWLHEEPHDYFRYTEHGLRMLCDEAGFASVEITVIAGGVDVLVDTAAKLLAFIPLVGRLLAGLLQGAWMSVGFAEVVRRANQQMSRRFPLAYGVVAVAARGPAEHSSPVQLVYVEGKA